VQYAYMCHFYANPISIFLTYSLDSDEFLFEVQPEHLEAIRTLPSFRRRIEALLKEHKTKEARKLLESDKALHEEIRRTLKRKREFIIKIQQAMHVYFTVASRRAHRTDRMDLYVKAFSGQLQDSDILKDLISSIKTMPPGEVLTLTGNILEKISSGDPETELEGWTESAEEFVEDLSRIQLEVQNLQNHAKAANTPLRSRYTTQSKVLRTTVVAQKVHLSKEQSSLSALDMSYSNLLTELTDLLEEYLKFENPLDQFLHEIWIYDSKSPYREVFTPKPRHAIERALSVPHDYLGCTCCKASEEGLSSSQSPTAILYQLYLETGSLINVFDLWSAFYAIVGGEDGADCDERNALVLFYRALADLKLLGMVKQSRKKTDHLAKLAWKGL
jgi:origin recognition complex subunit 3